MGRWLKQTNGLQVLCQTQTSKPVEFNILSLLVGEKLQVAHRPKVSRAVKCKQISCYCSVSNNMCHKCSSDVAQMGEILNLQPEFTLSDQILYSDDFSG